MTRNGKSSNKTSCPCTRGEPCITVGTGCTCKNGYSSYGCRRCCRFGSEEQRDAQAHFIIEKERLAGLVINAARKFRKEVASVMHLLPDNSPSSDAWETLTCALDQCDKKVDSSRSWPLSEEDEIADIGLATWLAQHQPTTQGMSRDDHIEYFRKKIEAYRKGAAQ